MEGLTLRDLANRFLSSKRHLVESGEMSPRSWSDYYYSLDALLERLGKTRRVVDLTPLDFEKLRASIAKTRGPVSLGNEIQRIRTLFKYAFDEGLIETPIRSARCSRSPTGRRCGRPATRQVQR